MDELFGFLMEMDKLKSVYRRSYLSDGSRNENSAEHSWHLALALLAMKEELSLEVDIFRAVKMALVHDVCEIGAGDISVYDPGRDAKEAEERVYIEGLSQGAVSFSRVIRDLWEEYEAQESEEARWVKVVDRILPFMMNIITEGRSWKEQGEPGRGIVRSQVVKINEPVKQQAPAVYGWILKKLDEAVEKGWLSEG